MIMDKDIPTADPGELIIQYTPLIYKISHRYEDALEKSGAVDLDDLLQAGRIAIYTAQKTYDPDKGASFLSYSFDRIRSAMRRSLGIDSNTGEPPPILESLDEPLSEDGDDTRLDFVPDAALTAEEQIIEQDTHNEAAEAVRAAVNRLKNSKQREVIKRCWLNGQERNVAADEMGIKLKTLQMVDLHAREKLRRDNLLKEYAIPFFHVTMSRFNTTWTSATEKAVIWREQKLFPELYSDGQEA